MIKFYKGTSTQLATKKADSNNICFLTDTSTLVMGGQTFGKDQFKVGVLDSISGNAAIGDFIFNTNDNKLYKKTGASTVDAVVDFPAIAQAKVDTLEAKLSTAFEAGNIVLGTATGITSSVYVPDANNLDFATATATTLSTTLVNAATLKAQIDTVNGSKATLTGGDGIAVTSGNATGGGIEWTIAADILTGSGISSSLKIVDGKLADDLKIEKLATATAGYAASYALKTGAGVQLGETIDIVKDQFLNGAEIVTGHKDGNTFVEGTAATDHKFIKLTFDVNTDGDADSEETAVNVIYLDVNDLVDVYTGVSGIAVNASNQISAVIDGTSEAFLTVGANGIKLSGVAAAIDADIQALGSVTADTNKYITAIGVNSSGVLTGSSAQVAAGQVAFTATGTIAATDVQTAIAEVATDAADALTAKVATLSAGEAGGTGKYITTISEADGIIAATAADLNAAAVAYTKSDRSVTTVGGGLDDVYSIISGMDLTQVGGGSGTTSVPYKFINTVSEADGKVSASDLDLTAANTIHTAVTEVLTTNTTAANARVGISAGTVQEALDKISNLIADYGSFHNADDTLA